MAKQKTLEQLLRWAHVVTVLWKWDMVKCKWIIASRYDVVTGKTLLSALRAAYKAWGPK